MRPVFISFERILTAKAMVFEWIIVDRSQNVLKTDLKYVH